MGFLAPGLLAAAVAIGLPIYLHLLRQHRSTPREFSSLMFFERSTQSSIKQRRLRHLLLLALRVAALLLLVLAFAGPYLLWTSPVLGGGRKLLVLVVDNSFSMRAGDRLERAKDEALAALRSRGAGNEVQVGALGMRLEFLTLPTSDPEEATAAIRSIEPSDMRSSYGELARAIRATSESTRLPMEVHLYTDVQRTSMPGSFGDLAIPDSVSLFVHPVVDDQEPNFAIENVIAPASVFDPEQASVQVTVAGYGTESARKTVSLLVDGEAVDSKSVEVPDTGRATVEFQPFPVRYGFNRCEVRMEADDALPEDNSFLFAAERADPRQILFVHSGRQSSRDLLYFRSAIEAAPDGAFRLQGMEMRRAADVDPSRYAVVVLSDPGRLPGGFEEKLKQYVRTGGSVMIAAGPATARLDRVPVMELPLLEPLYASRDHERFLAAAASDAAHPAVGVDKIFEAVKFYQVARVDPGEATVLGRLAGGVPLLVERRIGEGRTILFASTFDNVSNDLPLHPVFVAFVERVTRYLGRIEERASASWVGDFVDVRVAEQGQQAIGAEVIGPDGNRALSLEDAASAASFPVDEVGYYEIRRPNERNEMVAVNADRREANLAILAQDTLDLWETRHNSTGMDEGAATVKEVQNPLRLGWHFLLLAFLVMVSESALGAKYLGIDRGAA